MFSSKALTGTDPILKTNEIAEYSSFDDMSRKSWHAPSPLRDYPPEILL
jgi:hypothetical protein